MAAMEINTELKGLLEALLFVNEKPIMPQQLKQLFQGCDTGAINQALTELKNDYEKDNRGIKIIEIAGGFQMVSSPNYTHLLKKFYKKTKAERLSGPSLETAAIIAYKQPVTRMDIESLRGVNPQGVVDNLLERGLVRVVGRKRAAGRPLLYGTTRQFLEYFGLRSLEDLPKLEEFSKLAQEGVIETKDIDVSQKSLEVKQEQDNVIVEEVNANKENPQ